MSPLVSIIIPCFNAGRYLGATLASVSAQTWHRVETILIDDGSTDDSLEVAQRFASPTVKLIKQENAGAGAARNRGLRCAHGDYIQYLDADDLLSPDKIAAQVSCLRACDRRKLGVSATRYFTDGTAPESGVLQSGWPLVDTDDPLEWLIQLHGGNGAKQGSMVQTGSWLVPRAILDEAGPWDELPTPDDDGEYFARVVLVSTGIRRCLGGEVYYRKHPPTQGSLSSKRAKTFQEGALRSLELRATAILNRTSDAGARSALARCYAERAFVAYPYSRVVARRALQRARELGLYTVPSHFGSWRGRLLARFVGWRAARLINVWYHAAKRHLPATASGAARYTSHAS